MNMHDSIESALEALVQRAIALGASRAGAVASNVIVVKDRLAAKCKSPDCPNYGQSPGCPPHVGGPSVFRELQKALPHAIVFKIDVPPAVLFSEKRRQVQRRLHKVAAGVEQSAVNAGYAGAMAFAGGSCKDIFCHRHDDCPVVAGRGECRFPDDARPSMSGFGIDVLELLRACGWPAAVSAPDDNEMSWVAGLVLIG